MTIPSSRSLIFEVKSTGSELAFIRVYTSSKDFRRFRKTSDFFGRLQTSSEIFGNDRVVFKNPSAPRIKILRLYLRKSWQVYISPLRWATPSGHISLKGVIMPPSLLTSTLPFHWKRTCRMQEISILPEKVDTFHFRPSYWDNVHCNFM